MSKDWGQMKKVSPRDNAQMRTSAPHHSVKINASSIDSSNQRIEKISEKVFQNSKIITDSKKLPEQWFDKINYKCLTPKENNMPVQQQSFARYSLVDDSDQKMNSNIRLLQNGPNKSKRLKGLQNMRLNTLNFKTPANDGSSRKSREEELTELESKINLNKLT